MNLYDKDDFLKLKPKDKVYMVGNGEIKSGYFVSLSPLSNDHAVFLSGSNTSNAFTVYLERVDKSYIKYTTCYEQAKEILLGQVESKLESIKKIYFHNWDVDKWRDYTLKKITNA